MTGTDNAYSNCLVKINFFTTFKPVDRFALEISVTRLFYFSQVFLKLNPKKVFVDKFLSTDTFYVYIVIPYYVDRGFKIGVLQGWFILDMFSNIYDSIAPPYWRSKSLFLKGYAATKLTLKISIFLPEYRLWNPIIIVNAVAGTNTYFVKMLI